MVLTIVEVVTVVPELTVVVLVVIAGATEVKQPHATLIAPLPNSSLNARRHDGSGGVGRLAT